MFGVIESLIEIARQSLILRGEHQRLDELEEEVVTLRRKLNELLDYKERREVADEAARIVRLQEG
jgi:type II secretory pathway component PulJ